MNGTLNNFSFFKFTREPFKIIDGEKVIYGALKPNFVEEIFEVIPLGEVPKLNLIENNGENFDSNEQLCQIISLFPKEKNTYQISFTEAKALF